MDNFKNEHNSAADGDTLVFESPAAATNANGEPADGGNSGFFKKTFASVRSFFAKLFSDKKGANESMHSKPNNKNHSRAKRTSPNKADAPQGVFAPRKRPRSTLLAIVFTVIKLVVVAGILCGFIGLGLVLGIAKASTPRRRLIFPRSRKATAQATSMTATEI